MSVNSDVSDVLRKNVWSYSGKDYSFSNKKSIISNPLLGNWVCSSNECDTLVKINDISLIKEGIKFYKDGSLIRRSLFRVGENDNNEIYNYKGSWKSLTDSTLSLKYNLDFKVVKRKYNYKIIMGNKILVLKLIYNSH